MAVFGGVGVALDTELLDGVDGGQDDVDAVAAEAGGVRVVVDTIEEVVVLEGAVAVDADGAAESLVGVVCGAGREEDELSIVALVERELADLLALDELSALAGIGFEKGGARDDVDFFGQTKFAIAVE